MAFLTSSVQSVAGQLGNRVVEAVGGHDEQRGLVWRGQLGLIGASADGRADADFLPEWAGGENNTSSNTRSISIPGRSDAAALPAVSFPSSRTRLMARFSSVALSANFPAMACACESMPPANR
jgi:hypothetical protein